MKIIVNEHQYILIKEFINEAKQVNYSRGIKAKLGKHIIDLLDVIGEGETTEFTLGNNESVVLKCVQQSNFTYVFQIVKDEANIFNVFDGINKLQIQINPGNGEQDGTEEEYEKNRNIIKPSANPNNYTLIFKAFDKNGKNKGFTELGNIVKANSVLKPISPDNSVSQEEPTEEPLEDPVEPTEEPTEVQINNTKEEGKAAYAEILKDPALKQAFYKQPNFWQMFKSELTGKKPIGSGIIRAIDIVNRYNLKSFYLTLNKTLIDDKMVTIKFLHDYRMDFSKVKSIDFQKDKEYTMFIKTDKKGNKYLKGEINGIVFILTMDKPIQNLEHGFKSTKKGKEYEFEIVVDAKKSPGYRPQIKNS